MKYWQFLLLSLLTLSLFTAAAKPVAAWPGEGLWDWISCGANVNCTIRSVATSSINYVGYATLHEDLDSPNLDNVIAALQKGTWNEGLAAGAAKIGGLAYVSPPATLKNYFQTEFANNILNNPVQAVTGDEFLDPVRVAWKGIRNIAYGLFTIVMVSLGLGIIFQQQLPTRTVVTFTYALPKILFGLVLIRFSYPIVALFYDLGITFMSAVVARLFATNIFQVVQLAGENLASSFSGSLLAVLGYFLSALGVAIPDPFSAVLIAGIGLLVFLVVVGFIVVKLASAAAWLFIYTIFSPLIFLFGTLPGQEGSITDFFKQISAKVLVFPAMLFMIALAGFVAVAGSQGAQGAITSTLPGEYQDFALGRQAGIIAPLISITMLAATISIPGMIEKAFGLGRKK